MTSIVSCQISSIYNIHQLHVDGQDRWRSGTTSRQGGGKRGRSARGKSELQERASIHEWCQGRNDRTSDSHPTDATRCCAAVSKVTISGGWLDEAFYCFSRAGTTSVSLSLSRFLFARSRKHEGWAKETGEIKSV